MGLCLYMFFLTENNIYTIATKDSLEVIQLVPHKYTIVVWFSLAEIWYFLSFLDSLSPFQEQSFPIWKTLFILLFGESERLGGKVKIMKASFWGLLGLILITSIIPR